MFWTGSVPARSEVGQGAMVAISGAWRVAMGPEAWRVAMGPGSWGVVEGQEKGLGWKTEIGNQINDWSQKHTYTD